jgi:hypothetical protein
MIFPSASGCAQAMAWAAQTKQSGLEVLLSRPGAHFAGRESNSALHLTKRRRPMDIGVRSAYYKLASNDCTHPSRNPVTRETVHIVQTYVAGKGNRLKADTPVPCKSAETAQRTAERLAQTKIGVVAFSSSGDQELGEYDDEPVIIFKAGRLPPQFEE